MSYKAWEQLDPSVRWYSPQSAQPGEHVQTGRDMQNAIKIQWEQGEQQR